MHHYSGLLRVNLSGISHNWRFLKAQFSGGVCGAVVKADAYGLGVQVIAPFLYEQGCRDFFVATLAEALELRELVPVEARIYVLQGCCLGAESVFCEQGFLPVISSYEMWERWVYFPWKGKKHCALKVNTGMNRLGVDLPDFVKILHEERQSSAAGGIEVILSHLACADDPLSAINEVQLSVFKSFIGLARNDFPCVKASLVSSAGIALGDAWHFDIARPGIGLYGGGGELFEGRLSSVVSLHFPVIQIREVAPGEGIGYGGDFVARRYTRVAVVGGGYADGILRSSGGRARGWCGDYFPMIGRVSMDSCAFDITDAGPDLSIRVGDMMELFGDHISIDDAARACSTISYELLVRLGQRLQKEYVRASVHSGEKGA